MNRVLSKLFAVISAILIISVFASCNFNFDADATPQGNSIVVNLGNNSRALYTKEDAGWYKLSLYNADAVSFSVDMNYGVHLEYTKSPYKVVETASESVVIDEIPEGKYFLSVDVWTDSSKRDKVAEGYSLDTSIELAGGTPEEAAIAQSVFTVTKASLTNVIVKVNPCVKIVHESSSFNKDDLNMIRYYIDYYINRFPGNDEIQLLFDGEMDVSDINEEIKVLNEYTTKSFNLDFTNATITDNSSLELTPAKTVSRPFKISFNGYTGKLKYAGNGCLKGISAVARTTIEKGAFEGCTSLETVYLPGVTVIPEQAFYNCTSLSTINSTDNLRNVTEIGNNAFYMDEDNEGSLTNINLTNCVKIGTLAFHHCGSSLSVSDDYCDNAKWNGTINLTDPTAAETLRQGNNSVYTRTLN